MATTYGSLTVYSPNGNGGVSAFPSWSTQFSKDDESTSAGIGVHAYVGFNTFTVTITNGLITGFSLYAYSGAETKGTAPDPTYDAGSYTVTLNGTPIFGPSTSAPLASTLVSYSDINGISPCRITIAGSITAHVYSQSVSPSFSVTYDLYAQTANFVFSEYDSGIGATGSTFGFKMLFLEPPSVSNHGKLVAVKDKSFQSGTMLTAIYPPQGIPIEGNAVPNDSRAVLTVNGQCNTYMIDNTNSVYRVLNIYPSNNQPSLSTINASALTPVSATSDLVNIFSVDSSPGRQSANNLVQLPTAANPAGFGDMKIIVYGGNLSTKYTGNVLAIEEPSGGLLIDNTYGSTTKPYIQTDASGTEKNTGIVFIANEDQWFVLGYYPTTNWTWDTLNILTPTKTIPNDTVQFDLVSTNANAIIGTPISTSLSVVKVQTVSGSPPYIKFQAVGSGSTFNAAGQNTYYTGNSTNSATWIITQYPGASTTCLNFIVVAYTPS